MALRAIHKSTNILTATLTDSGGSNVAGATVTVTIVDKNGTAVVTGAPMVEQGDNTYDYTIADSLLSETERYIAKITAVSGGNKRYVEVGLDNVIDNS